MTRRGFLAAVGCAGRAGHAQDTGERSHPLLFFDGGDIANLKQKVQSSPVGAWYASLRASASAGFSYFGLNENARSQYACDMAFVYLIEGQEAWREKTAEFLQTAGDYDKDWYEFGWAWGGNLLFYAMAYDWVQSGLQPSQDEAIKAKLEATSEKTFDVLKVPPTGSNRPAYYTNVRMRVAGGLGAVALALGAYGQARTRLEWIVEDLFGNSHAAPNAVAAVVGSDGIYLEGSSYQNNSFDVMAPFLLACRRMTGIDWFSGGEGRYDDRIARMFQTNIQLMMPDRGAPTLNTGWMGISSMHEVVASVLPDAPRQMWYWNEAARRGTTVRALSIVFYDPSLDAQSEPPAYLSQILSNAACFRSGWRPDDTWLLIDTSHEPSKSTHDQPDQTSIAVYARKAYLLIDPGDGRNYPTDEGHTWLRYSPAAHNLVIVDGKEGPVAGSKRTTGTPSKRWAYATDSDPVRDGAPVNEGFTSAHMDYVECGIPSYHDAPDVGTKRSVFFPNREYFVLLDEMTSVNEHSYAQLFHFGGAEGPGKIEGMLQVDGNDVRWRTRNNDREEVEMRLLFASAEVSITEHTGYTNYRVGGGDIVGAVVRGNQVTFDHTYIQAAVRGSTLSFLTLLLPQKVSEADSRWTPVAEALPVRGGSLGWSGYTDIHGLALGGGEWTVEDLTATAAYAYARVAGDAIRNIAMKRGIRVGYRGQPWLAASEPVTAALDAGDPNNVRVALADAQKPLRLSVRTPSLAASVRWNGVPKDFAQEGDMISVQLDGGGELEIALALPGVEQ